MGQVDFAAGFASVRAFNRVVADIFARSSTELPPAARRRPAALMLPAVLLAC
jgi:AraC family transcriptional regulator of adaptative response / DNA-3-methyladenine glycosylase II